MYTCTCTSRPSVADLKRNMVSIRIRTIGLSEESRANVIVNDFLRHPKECCGGRVECIHTSPLNYNNFIAFRELLYRTVLNSKRITSIIIIIKKIIQNKTVCVVLTK